MSAIPGLGLGRVVIFVHQSGTEYAAIVSRVLNPETGEVTLHVMNDVGDGDVVVVIRSSMYAESGPGWYWPPRI